MNYKRVFKQNKKTKAEKILQKTGNIQLYEQRLLSLNIIYSTTYLKTQ
jgi:hypothetical protein